MQYVSITGLTARVHRLPNRPPFITAADLAEAYSVPVKQIGQNVRRNPRRFPETFAFRLTPSETERWSQFVTTSTARWSQFAATSAGSRTDLEPLVFTDAGALMLSAVLRSERAIEVSVEIHAAFAEMERRVAEETRLFLTRTRAFVSARKPSWTAILVAIEAGYDFEGVWRCGDRSRPKVALALREMLAADVIAALPAGTPEISGRSDSPAPLEQLPLFGGDDA